MGCERSAFALAFPFLSLPTWVQWIKCVLGGVWGGRAGGCRGGDQGELASFIGSGLHQGKDRSIWSGAGEEEQGVRAREPHAPKRSWAPDPSCHLARPRR